MSPQLIVLLSFLVFVIAAFSGKVKIHVAAMLIPIILEVTGVLTFEETWSGLVNNSVIMMAAMFVVAAGLNKTDIVVRLSRLILKPNSSDAAIMLSLLIPSILLGSVVNGMAALAIMLPIMYQICAEFKRPVSKFAMGLYVMVGIWGGFLPFGGNSASYLAHNAIIERLGGVGEFTYFTNMIVKAPWTLIGTIVLVLIGTKFAPDNGNIPVIGQAFEDEAPRGGRRKADPLSPLKSKIAIGIFAATVVGIVVCALTKINAWWPAMIGAMLMVLSGVLDDREAIHSMASPIIFIFVGTLPLATAIQKTGCDTIISDAFSAVTSGWSPFFIMLAMYLVTMILSQFLQNSAVNSIFRLLAPVIAIQGGFNPTAMMLAAQFGTTNSYLFPAANAMATMVYGKSGMNMKQWFTNGLIYTVLQLILFMLWVPIVYPLA